MPQNEVSHSAGRDFYDDGYDSDEADNVDGVRLDFSKIPFSGRKDSLELLHNIYNDVCKNNEIYSPAAVTLISGFSGSGKSALVQKFVEEINQKTILRSTSTSTSTTRSESIKKKSYYYIHGKFNELRSEKPFSAICEAIRAFLLELLKGEKSLLEKFREDLKKSLSKDAIALLATVSPDLRIILTPPNEQVSSTYSTYSYIHQGEEHPDYRYCGESTLNRLRYAFITFLKVISSAEHPVIMFLDDLQWIDSSSLDLITYLLTDTSLRYLMFIGSYRCDALDGNHPFSKSLQKVAKIHAIEKIELLNLSFEEMTECLCSLLELYIEEVTPLAKALFGKSRGNMFFTKQLLETFQRENILYYCKISFQWKWNLKDLDLELEQSVNVDDVVINKIKSTPERLQKVLKVFICASSNIDIDTLHLLMQKVGYPVQLDELVKILDLAVLEGIFTNKVGSKSYKFTHDRIHQAARSLLPPGEEKDAIREKIGIALYDSCLTDTGEDWMLFVAADNLNQINFQLRDPIKMVLLNLQVGEMALKVAAFGLASTYLEYGMGAISRIKNHWTKQYNLTLRLYQVFVDVELILGRYNMGEKVALDLFRNAKDVKDKFPTYMSIGQALGQQDHIKALNFFNDALELVGERQTNLRLTLLPCHLLCAIWYFETHSDDDILNLPMIKDDTKLAAMRFYDAANIQNYYLGNMVGYITCLIRRVRITFKHGLCESTPLIFAHFAILMGKLNHRSSLRCAQLARKVLAITKGKNIESQTLFFLHFFTEGWSSTYEESIKTLQYARRVGNETGQIEWALNSWEHEVNMGFLAGRRLDYLLTECTNVMEQANVINAKALYEIYEQARLRLLYLAHPVNWGELMNFGPKLNASDETYRLIQGYITRLVLAVYYQNYTYVEEWVKQLAKAAVMDSSFEFEILATYYSGLALSGLFRTTKRKKFIFMANRETSKMKQIIKNREIKYNHRYLIMKVDMMTLSEKRNKIEVIRKKFEKAISVSMKTNHIHDAAFCNELAAGYFLDKNEEDLAIKHFGEAKKLYEM